LSLSKRKRLPKTAAVDKSGAVNSGSSMPGNVKPYDTYDGVEELRYEENEPSPLG
jgi:hypothetical protein